MFTGSGHHRLQTEPGPVPGSAIMADEDEEGLGDR